MKHLFASTALVLITATSAFAADAISSDPHAVVGGVYNVESSHTRVQFSVSHMGFTNWYGDFTDIKGTLRLDPKNITASTVDITIPVASVSTTNSKLDGELKSAEWLDATQFPTMHFVSSKIVQTAPNKANITGDLSFHGVTKPVTLSATFNAAGANPMSKNYTVGFDATTTIKRSDFGVKTYVPMIGDETAVRVSAAFEAAK